MNIRIPVSAVSSLVVKDGVYNISVVSSDLVEIDEPVENTSTAFVEAHAVNSSAPPTNAKTAEPEATSGEPLGTLLRLFRSRNDISQAEVAQHFAVSQIFVSMIESGKYKVIPGSRIESQIQELIKHHTI